MISGFVVSFQNSSEASLGFYYPDLFVSYNHHSELEKLVGPVGPLVSTPFHLQFIAE